MYSLKHTDEDISSIYQVYQEIGTPIVHCCVSLWYGQRPFYP